MATTAMSARRFYGRLQGQPFIFAVVIVLLCWCDAVVVRGPNAHNVSIPRLPIISFTRREFASTNCSFGSIVVEFVEFSLTGYNEASF